MVPLDEVDFRENLAPGEVGREVMEMRNGVGITDSALVEAPVVAARARSAIILVDHVEAGAPRRVGTAANARSAHEIEVFVGDPKLFWHQPPRLRLDRRAGSVDEAFEVVPGRAGR